MTDERYVFNQDIRERSKMRTGAIHKVNGSKSKKCTLPSDHLTPTQKRKLNGECKSINLGKPITNFGEFRAYPYNLQQEYLQNLVTNYGARKIDICNMLGINNSNFDRYMRAHGIEVTFGQSVRGKHSRMDDRFLEFITRPDEDTARVPNKTDEQILEERFGIKPIAKEVEPEPSEAPIEQYVAPETPVAVNAFAFASMVNAHMVLQGSKKDILMALENLLVDGADYKMVFELDVKNDIS